MEPAQIIAIQTSIMRALEAARALDEALTRVLASLCDTLGWSFAAFWEARGTEPLQAGAVHARDPVRLAPLIEATWTQTFAAGVGLPGRVLATGQAIWVEDLAGEPDLPRLVAFHAVGMHGAILVPLYYQGTILGVCELFSDRVQPRDEHLLQIMTVIGIQLGQFIDRHRTEEALRRHIAEGEKEVARRQASERRTQLIIENALDAVVTCDEDGLVTEWNKQAEAIYGLRAEDVVGRPMAELVIPPELRERHHQGMAQYLRSGEGRILNKRIEITSINAKGEAFPVELAVTAQRLGNRHHFTAFIRDISQQKEAAAVLAQHRERLERLVEERTAALLRETEERRRAEQAARQAEQLQALGQLTGGIAHDFNNILQVIASGVALLKMPATTEERRQRVLDGMAQAARNATALTSRLLAFARQQRLKPEIFDLNERLTGTAEMLGRTLGSRIQLETDLAPGLWPVQADPGQLDVALLNLALNARDAMPDGGRLTLRTRNALLPATAERAAGEYVTVTVEDTGEGMAPDVLARVFEPFFTTKAVGKGTGLGLPQVHGFAKQSGGDIEIASTQGEGTRITLHLPHAGKAAAGDSGRPAAETAVARLAGRRVLVVEDNPQVRESVSNLLKELGCLTQAAANADEALRQLAAGSGIDAVFSDVVMPGTSGIELAQHLRRHHPGVAVLLATGYSEALTRRNGEAEPTVEVLRKPYTLEALAAALERALGGAAVEGHRSHAAEETT